MRPVEDRRAANRRRTGTVRARAAAKNGKRPMRRTPPVEADIPICSIIFTQNAVIIPESAGPGHRFVPPSEENCLL